MHIILEYHIITGCGESSKLQVSTYIVGGRIVDLSSHWPWMMPIYYAGALAGAGVHIGDGWLVTAGHLARVQRVRDGARYIELYVYTLLVLFLGTKRK